ncbi:MAG TPA: adenylate/guanylate cyclase domain-containing protein [Actinomycetota bacterium]|nr:adenylate/guanylate cyclase domain-containing protein [Actinomycetota bacterium]
MVDPPELRYAMNGPWRLAYHVLGDGPDLMYLPGWVSNVEGNWLAPDHARFLEGLASFARTIVVDRRGVGCSDRYPPGETCTLEECVEDLRLVARAANSSRAAMFAVQEGGFYALMAAATHPQRFTKLILFGAAHTWQQTSETPWGWSDEDFEDMEAAFGGPALTDVAEAYIRNALPSYAGDPAAIRRMAMLLALTESPGSGIAESVMTRQINLRDLLPTIVVPTLVLHRTEDPIESVESGRYLAEHIPGATLVELPGRDTLPWVGESEAVIEEIRRFLLGEDATVTRAPSSRSLATVLFTDVVGSTEHVAKLGDVGYRQMLERHHRAIRAELRRHRGIEVDTAGDGFFATFDGPARAIECALAICEVVRPLGIEVRAGVHTGEVETIDGKVGGLGVHIGSRVSAAAGPSEVLVSSTVKDLVAGSGLVLEDAGEHELKGVPERWRLYRATMPASR